MNFTTDRSARIGPPALATCLGLLLIAQTAFAFERSRDSYTKRCLWLPQRQVAFYLDRDCAIEGSHERCVRAVRSAMAVWNSAPCSDLTLVLAGTTRSEIGTDLETTAANLNLILVHGPDHRAEEEPRSLSTITYDRTTGVIVDVDLELDDRRAELTEADLHNILIHELGHGLGLDHNREDQAIMYPYHTPGAAPRGLSADDLVAICTLYPRGLPTPDCDGPDLEPQPESGCQSAPGPWTWPVLLAILLAAAILWRARIRPGLD